jgi:hypothetical protein
MDASTDEASMIDTSLSDISLPDTGDVALTPCVSGNWWVRVIPGDCPLCGFCSIYKTPPAYTTQITGTIPVLNCTAILTGVQWSNTCTYQNLDKCTPTYDFGDGGLETFTWDGIITFQQFTGFIDVGSGRIEHLTKQEIGLSGLVYGQDAGMPCPYRILLTKEEE